MAGDVKSGRIYPHVWKYGPDPLKHDIHLGYMRAKAQCDFRKEPWHLTFEEYFEMWKDQWDNRGRKGDNVCMTRRDPEKPWDKDNTIIITRKEHLREQGLQRAGKSVRYKPKTSKVRYYKMKVIT